MPPKPLHPLEWNFSSCPKEEVPYLFFYEYARELRWIIEAVEAIRNSHAKPKFDWHDWPEWPRRPYLWLPKLKRKRRLKALQALPDDLIFSIRIFPLLGKEQRPGWLSLDYPVTKKVNPKELIAAIAFDVGLYWTNPELMRPRSTGRAGSQAAFWTRLRALSVYRLYRHHTSSSKSLSIHQKAWRPAQFSSASALNRARYKAKVYLDNFSEMASLRIKSGHWFPPFAEIAF